MKKKAFNMNLIIAVLVIPAILFFMSWFESCYAIKNDNDLQGEEFDYIFDPGEYIDKEEEELMKEEKDANINNLDSEDSSLPSQSDQLQKIDSENTNVIKETNNKDRLSPGSKDTYNEENNWNIEDNILVKARLNLMNLEKRGYLSIVAFINGQEVFKNITLDKIDNSKQLLNVNLPVNKETNIIQAGDRDEFFVCAYHVKNLLKEYNSLTYFDCDEGDLTGSDKPTIARLFSPNSLVYKESQNIFNNSSKYSQLLSTSNGAKSNSDIEKEKEEKDTVKVKVYAPLEDRKDTQKLKIIAMVKGQIKSAIIDNVQEEFEKTGGYTISRTFIFDRDTNIGKIVVGDKFFACVASTDLNPPEGQECEKRVIKSIERPNILYAR